MNLIINTHSISQHNGFFSLTDLHKASGNQDKHKPVLFLRNQQTQELISEIELENKVAYHTIKGNRSDGAKSGTYACRELVYRYAMWISPKFSLMVIRAFDALNTGAIPCLRQCGLSHRQAATLQKAVKAKCRYDRRHYQRLYNALYDEFGVKSYKDILPEDFEAAMDFIQAFRFDEHEELARSAELLAWHTQRIYDWYKQIEHPLRAIAPQLSAQVHDHIIYANGYAGQVGRRLAMTR